MLRAAALKEKALALGFDLVGITPAGEAPHGAQLLEWCESGYCGEMVYMTRSADARADTRIRFPWARSVVCVAMSYPSAPILGTEPENAGASDREAGVNEAPPAPRTDQHETRTPRLGSARGGLPPSRGLTHGAPSPTRGPARGGTSRAQQGRSDTAHGRVSCYAWGNDYHDVMGRALADLEKFMQREGARRTKLYVDTGPVLERDWAASAGLGWIGKNTTLVNQRLGSWLFLGVILVDLELPPDDPHPDRCGTCTECIDSCPTGAFAAPYVLDSRLCISYLTIEHKGVLPLELRPLMGNWIFGCDICQAACPWNRKAASSDNTAFAARVGLSPMNLERALKNSEGLSELVAGTPVERAKGARLERNIIVAAGNSGSPQLARALESYAVKAPPGLPEYVSWALKRLSDHQARIE